MPRRITGSRPLTSNPALDSFLLTPYPATASTFALPSNRVQEARCHKAFPTDPTIGVYPEIPEDVPSLAAVTPSLTRSPLLFLYTL